MGKSERARIAAQASQPIEQRLIGRSRQQCGKQRVFLRSGGISMEIMAQVPAALTLVIQGLIVIAVAGSVILVDKLQGAR